MPVIGVLICEGGIRDEVARQLTGLADLEFCPNADTAVSRSIDGAIDLLITQFADEAGASRAHMVATLAARASRVPVIIYDRVNRSTMDGLYAMVIPGLPIDIVLRPVEPLAPTVRRVLAATLPPSVAPILIARLRRTAPPGLAPFTAIAALKAPTQRGVDQLAHWSGVTPRTIERRLGRAHWVAAHVLLQSFRALDVLWYLTQYRWTVRRVQQARGFAHSSAITRLTTRYAGVAPADVREGVDFRAVLSTVLRTVTGEVAA